MDAGLVTTYSDRSTQAGDRQIQSASPCLDRQIAQLHTLQEISCKLNSKLELEDVLINILDEAIRAIGAERGCLLLANAATDDLEVRLGRHLRPSELNGRPFQLSRTVIERVWHSGQPVLTANALEDPELGKVDSVINYTLRSILCVPLHVQGQRIGVLYLDNRLRAGQFHEDDLALAVAIADQAAIALRNAQLHQEALDRAQRLMEVFQRVQAVNQISLKVQGLTDFAELFAVIGGELEQFGCHCAIALLNSDGTHLETRYVSSNATTGSPILASEAKAACVPVSETVICQQVLEARIGRFVSDIDEVMAELSKHPISIECQLAFVAPLVANNRPIGLLILGLNHTRREDGSLLTAFANQVATTIETCRLHAELQQRLAEMQSVLTITRALVSEISLNNCLEFIMTQAEHLTNAEGSAVLLRSDDGEGLEVAPPDELRSETETGSRVALHGTLAELAIASQKVQISNRAQDDDRAVFVRALLGPAELHSLLCAPLVTQDKSVGVLLVWNKREKAFTGHDSRLMGLFADHAALALHNAHLYKRNRQLAIEQERHRLARELHDTVTQSLYSIAMAAQTSLKLLGQTNTNGMARDPIEHILALSRTALAEMREQLFDLYPTTLGEQGLVRALAQHCDALSARYPLAIEFTACPEPAFSMQQREALYYIAREALCNVVRHAGSKHVDISLTTENGQVILSIEDDGAGFDPSVFARDETMGLRNIEERTKLLGATFELGSRLGCGTRITVRLPVQASGNETFPR
jgi:signal transduction histidine kinase